MDAAIETVGLTGRDRDRYKAYSLGMKQRLAIAATLLKSPDLLILDEPTNGLDPAGRDEMLELIRRIGTEFGISVLVTSHLLGELERVCDTVVVIDAGRVVHTGSAAELINDQELTRELLGVSMRRGAAA